MESILYYFAQVLLLMCSLMMGFVDGTQTYIMCISCLITGFLLMLTYVVKTKVHWPGFCLYGLVVFCHLFYLSVNTAYSSIMMVGLTLFAILAFGSAFYSLRFPASIERTLSFILFEKIALIPEILLNYLISRQSGNAMFANFSWVLLAITSLHAIFCIQKMIRAKMVMQSWGIALGVLQFFFFTDILSTGALMVLAAKANPRPKKHLFKKKPPQEDPLPSKKRKRLKRQNVDFKDF